MRRTKQFRRRAFDAFILRCNQLSKMSEDQIDKETKRVFHEEFPSINLNTATLTEKLMLLVKNSAFCSFDEL